MESSKGVVETENIWEWLYRQGMQMVLVLFACRHVNVPMVEGKSYCPDCGCGVVFQWVNLRCHGCGVRRDTASLWGRILPAQAVCTRCGESAVWPEYLENARPYQIHRARLVMHVDSDYEQHQAFWQPGLDKVRAWVLSQHMESPAEGTFNGALLPA